VEILNKPMYGGDGSVWFEAVVGDREYDEILDFTANRKDYVKVDHTLLVNGVWVNGEKYISQSEFNKLNNDLDELEECYGIECSANMGLKDELNACQEYNDSISREISKLREHNTQYAKRNYELNEEIQQIERESDFRYDLNIELQNLLEATKEENQELKKQLTDERLRQSTAANEICKFFDQNINTDDFVSRITLIQAEEENQKLIDKNWELEKALMGERGYKLVGEEWILNFDKKINSLGMDDWIPWNIPIGKVI